MKNMYAKSIKQWNPFAGCEHDCCYCVSSFQRQLKRQKGRCMDCYTFKPHKHPNRLANSLPKTKDDEFIFTCSSGDIAFASVEYFNTILDVIRSKPNRNFLLQTKDPKAFIGKEYSQNVLLGCTIETNRDSLYLENKISKAPVPSKRFEDFLNIQHHRKMVTVEPIMVFDSDILVDWIKDINPELVWVGYDSKKNHLPEPELKTVMEFIENLRNHGISVHEKTIREPYR